MVNKRVRNAVLDAISKTTEWSLFVSKANHSISWKSKSMPRPSNAEEAEVERFYEDLQDLLELTPKKDRGLQCKSRKSRNTWSNRQIWPWSTEWSRAKANRVLPRECTGHSKHPLPTTQEKTLHMDITRWSIPKLDWLNSLQPKMEMFYTVSNNKIRADCGLDHELLIAKFRLKLKKGEITTRPSGMTKIKYIMTIQ